MLLGILQAGGGVLSSESWGTQRTGGLTEAQIREELQGSGVDEIPMAVRNASNTISWWRGRQAVIDLKVSPCVSAFPKLTHTQVLHLFGGSSAS